MKIEKTKEIIFKQNKQNKVCFVKHDGRYIFSPLEAMKLGHTEETEEHTIYRLYYKDEKNLQEAIKMMPDYKCWDSERHVLLK